MISRCIKPILAAKILRCQRPIFHPSTRPIPRALFNGLRQLSFLRQIRFLKIHVQVVTPCWMAEEKRAGSRISIILSETLVYVFGFVIVTLSALSLKMGGNTSFFSKVFTKVESIIQFATNLIHMIVNRHTFPVERILGCIADSSASTTVLRASFLISGSTPPLLEPHRITTSESPR